MIVYLRRRSDPRVANRFFSNISENLDGVLLRFDSRWLISVVETFADRHPDHGTRGAALVVSTLLKWECFARTAFAPGPEPPGSDHLYDGLWKLGMSNPGMDTHRNFFRRIRRQLSSDPVVLEIFRELMHRNLDDPSSTFARLDEFHPRNLTSDIRCVIDATPESYFETLAAAGSDGQDDEHFVDSCYETILRRAPDQDGRRHYLRWLREGATRYMVVEALAESEEYHRLVNGGGRRR